MRKVTKIIVFHNLDFSNTSVLFFKIGLHPTSQSKKNRAGSRAEEKTFQGQK